MLEPNVKLKRFIYLTVYTISKLRREKQANYVQTNVNYSA